MSLRDVIAERIRRQGPLSMADYMELALYHPTLGYYARRDRRSGRAGDFFTSVDVGTRFGELLSKQLHEMWQLLAQTSDHHDDDPFVVVEAGAGSGRLARDILDCARRTLPELYAAIRLTLVERSPAGRAAQTETLAAHQGRFRSSEGLPEDVEGVIVANELLDALPVHSIVMTGEGLREVQVGLDGDRLRECLATPSGAVRAHLDRFGVTLQPGWRAEVCPAAVSWIETAAARLDRGFLIVIDYGHEARELYSPTHAAGTLTCYRRHRVSTGGDQPKGAPWLDDPGESDITAHVDLTAVATAAEQSGLATLGRLDQTYFLLSLAEGEAASDDGNDIEAVKRRLALKTLLVPGGLGSSHKVMIFGKNVGTPALRGCAFAHRLT